MSRKCQDWLTSFMDYAKHGEAPNHMYFWTGVSAIAGALRRKVWIDQYYFKWYCNMYIVMVAPPGIVAKSTTSAVGMNLLRQVPGINFGPDIVTWPALTEAFSKATEAFPLTPEEFMPMSALTFEASEFGNLLNPQDKDMVDLLVSLWDGKSGTFKKVTRHSGSDEIENPWINLIACTTPSWIAQNFPEYMIGGGFTSRCVFVYADKKRQFVAYPGKVVPTGIDQQRLDLIDDLIEISKLAGQFTITPEAYEWGDAWYRQHHTERSITMSDDRFGGYIARKQTLQHKVAMILSASQGDSLTITAEHLQIANTMLTDLEPDMAFVFSKVGKSEAAFKIERLVDYVHAAGKVNLESAYRKVHSYFPSVRDFEDVLAGCVKAGYIRTKSEGGELQLIPGQPLPSTMQR